MAGEVRDDLVLMGFIGKPHGVRGDVKVVPETDDPTRFEEIDRLYLEIEGTRRPYTVKHVRLQSSARGLIPVLTLDGVTDRNEADALRGVSVFAAEEDLELEEDEFFLHDLVGLPTEDEEGERLGEVADVLSLPAGPVLVIRRSGGSEALIPAVDEFIVRVEDDRIVVRVIEGLLDS